MRRFRQFCKRGSKFEVVFLFVLLFVDEDTNTTLRARFAGMPMIVQRWCWLVSFFIFQEIQGSIAMKPYILVIFFFGGGGGL